MGQARLNTSLFTRGIPCQRYSITGRIDFLTCTCLTDHVMVTMVMATMVMFTMTMVTTTTAWLAVLFGRLPFADLDTLYISRNSGISATIETLHKIWSIWFECDQAFMQAGQAKCPRVFLQCSVAKNKATYFGFKSYLFMSTKRSRVLWFSKRTWIHFPPKIIVNGINFWMLYCWFSLLASCRLDVATLRFT